VAHYQDFAVALAQLQQGLAHARPQLLADELLTRRALAADEQVGQLGDRFVRSAAGSSRSTLRRLAREMPAVDVDQPLRGDLSQPGVRTGAAAPANSRPAGGAP